MDVLPRRDGPSTLARAAWWMSTARRGGRADTVRGGVRRRTTRARRPAPRWRGRARGALAGVLERVDLALAVEPVEQVAARVRHQGLELDARAGAARPRRPCSAVVDALAGLGGDDDRVRLALPQPRDHHRVGRVGLVDDDDLGHLVGADLGQHRPDGSDLALGVGVRAVDDVQDQVGVGDLLQRRAERLDEPVRAGRGRSRPCRSSCRRGRRRSPYAGWSGRGSRTASPPRARPRRSAG